MSGNAIIRLRRDTAANWTAGNPVLALGEPGFETDTRKIKLGDGATAWAGLSYLTAVASSVADADYGDISITSGVWSIDPGVVSLAKMANIASGSLIYRKTAGAGAPEVQSLATLKTDLAITSGDVSGLTYFATGTDAANLTGTVAAARLPAFSGGDATSSAGSAVLTVTGGTGSPFPITAPAAGDAFVDLRGDAAHNRMFRIQNRSASTRWVFGAENTAESGASAGSNFVLDRYDDAGGFAARVFTVTRSNGNVAFAAALSASNLSGTNTGDQTTVSGNAGSATILQTSRNFSITGGGITAAAIGFDGSAAVALSASVDAGHITLARMANLAANSFIGNNTGSPATPIAMTVAQAKTLLAIAESDVTNLTTDLAAKAPLANPEFTGVAFYQQPSPTARNSTTTLTIADLLTLIITSTSTTAVSLTLPTGTLTDAGILSGALPNNEGFEWVLINLGSSSGAVTLVAGVNHTIVGQAVTPIGSATASGVSRWFTRKTATNTFITYRIG